MEPILLVSNEADGVVQRDLRCAGRVSDHLVHTDSGTPLEVTLEVTADPDNVGADGRVEAGCNDVERKVATAYRFDGGEDDVACSSISWQVQESLDVPIKLRVMPKTMKGLR